MKIMPLAAAAPVRLLALALLLGAARLMAGPDSSAEGAPAGKTNALVFVPAREGVLPGSAPCRMHYLQFHTGNHIAIGEGPGDSSDHAEHYQRAEETGGLDASAIGGPQGFQLAGRGCVFNRVPASKWETLTAEEVVQALRRESWLYGVVEIDKKDFPATYLFKTARGECGVFQVLGAAADERGWNRHGMKYRYKLVRPANKGAAARPVRGLQSAQRKAASKDEIRSAKPETNPKAAKREQTDTTRYAPVMI